MSRRNNHNRWEGNYGHRTADERRRELCEILTEALEITQQLDILDTNHPLNHAEFDLSTTSVLSIDADMNSDTSSSESSNEEEKEESKQGATTEAGTRHDISDDSKKDHESEPDGC